MTHQDKPTHRQRQHEENARAETRFAARLERQGEARAASAARDRAAEYRLAARFLRRHGKAGLRRIGSHWPY